MVSDKYPKTLSAPVDLDTWTWFVSQAEAEDRTASAHLRRLVLAHKAEVEGRGQMTEEFAEALRRRMPIGRPVDRGPGGYPRGEPYVGAAEPGTSVTWPEGETEPADPDPEGMT